ncbi:MAG: hypothetical protein ACOY3K_07150 [Candidatus Omnitrophota bacterium]
MIREKIPVILCLDVEPDPRIPKIAARDHWEGFERTYHLLAPFRARLEQATENPVHYSWFFRLDPQIKRLYGHAAWLLHHYSSWIRNLEQYQDELGVHPHTFRWDPQAEEWVAEHEDLDYCKTCVQMSFDEYRDFFGRNCTAYRFGDRWTSSEAIQWCEANGAKFDLTLEPGLEPRPHVMLRERHTGSLPDFRTVPQEPYIPSRKDFRIKDTQGRTGPVMIPLSCAKIPGILGALHRFSRKTLRQKTCEQPVLTLSLDLKPWIFRILIGEFLKRSVRPYLAMVTRVGSASKTRTAAFMRANLDSLVNHPRVRDFVFSTPAEAFALLRGPEEKDNAEIQVRPSFAMP